MGAPDWKARIDGITGESVLIEYKGQNAAARVSWYRAKNRYYEAVAIAMPMNSGIAMVAFGEEFVESYVVNINTLELFFTSIRSGGARLPNAVKSFRGTCVPAGNLSR